jgi:periplasmic divalent cation tolerance protein
MPTAYVTVPPDSAARIALALVEDRLAACVNRVTCRSTYRWEGEITEDDEEILFVKTTDEAYEDLTERIRELHPHDVPCIERFDEDTVFPPFAEWRDGAVER